MDVESRIEPLCNTILRCDAENWDTRNKAVLQIIDIVRSYEGQSLTTISDAFGPSVFRLLKEPVKSLISDLRSQQVRDVCTLLVTLAKVTGERMKPFLRDSFAHIIEGVKVPNKVMSGYVDDCIQNMIQYCTFKSCIPVILMEFKDNKAKTFREKCLEYLNSILLFWDMTDKDLEPICDALKIGLEDASPKARETARTVFQSLYNINPRRAERLRSDLPRSVQAKLQVDETSALETSTSSIVLDQPLPEPPRTAERPRMMHASQTMSSHKLHTSGSSHSMSGLARADMSKSFSGSTSASSSLFAPSSSVEPPSAPEPVVDTPAPSSTSRASVMSAKAAAAAASSAGSRRRSVVKNPFADISDSFAQGNSLSNSLSSSQEFPSAFPKMSPSKPSPTSNKSKTSPAIASEYSGYNSGASSPAGGVITRSAPFQDSRPFSNLSDSRPVNGNFSASTTLESLGSVNSTSSAASVPESKALTLHGRVYAQIAKDNRVAATVRFIGQTQFAPGTWVGVELDTPMGKNNGSVQGIAYFNCRMNFGLFLREENVSPVPSVSDGEKRILALTKSASASEANFPTPSVDNPSPSSIAMSSSGLLLEKATLTKSASSEIAERRSKSAGMLKLKLSTMMNFLNAQLELVDDLEREEKVNAESSKANELRNQVKSITESELETIISFRNKWKEFV